MKRIENLQKDQWNAFVAANAGDGGLLQSWEWGTLEHAKGHTIHRLAWGDDEIDACALLVERTLPFRWKYLYCPRGPVSKSNLPRRQAGGSNESWNRLVNDLTTFAKKQHAVFLRLEPSYSHCQNLDISKYAASRTVQPSKTLRVPLEPSEENLLAAMHQKTRYNIRLAERSGVTIDACNISSNPHELDHFLKLLKATTTRDGFQGHTDAHYRLLLHHLDARLFLAKHGGDIIAGAIVAFFETTAYYLHGASSNEKRDVMAPHLLQWHIMREAKQRGCTVYDLWGVDEIRWPGVTRFKMGFAPSQPIMKYPGTFDLPVSDWRYTLYSCVKKMR